MIVIRAVIRINDGQADAARAEATAVRSRSLLRDGVLAYDFFKLDEDRIVVIEVYDSSETLLAHINGGGFEALFSVTAVEDLEIYGDPSDEVTAIFSGITAPAIRPSFTS